MKNILCFGDSNTFGLRPGTNNLRYAYEERWTGIVNERVRTEGYRVIEEGLCGRTTIFEDTVRMGRNGASLLPVVLETHNPISLVVLMLGTNDCKACYDASPDTISEGIRKLIHQIKNSNQNSDILLVSPIELGEDVWDGYDEDFNQKSVGTSKQLVAAYQKIAREENIYFMAASKYAEPCEIDREHLNEEGHRKIAKAIGDRIESIIREDNYLHPAEKILC